MVRFECGRCCALSVTVMEGYGNTPVSRILEHWRYEWEAT